MTNSSLSASENYNKCTTTLAVNHDTPQMSGQNSTKMRDQENQIEIINIS